MAEESMSQNSDLILGELRGQVRELVHGVNNLQQKVDGLTREVSAMSSLTTDFADMKARLIVLETQYLKEVGARGVFAAVVKSPFFAYLIAAFVSVYTLFYVNLKGD